MNKLVIAILTAASLTSCAHLITETDDMMARGSKANYCSDQDPEKVIDLINRFYKFCFQNQNLYQNGVKISPTYYRFEGVSESGKTYSLLQGKYYRYYVLVHDEPTQSCRSEFDVYSSEKSGKKGHRTFRPFDLISKNGMYEC